MTKKTFLSPHVLSVLRLVRPMPHHKILKLLYLQVRKLNMLCVDCRRYWV